MEATGDPALESVINEELAPLNRDELYGIWRSLCGLMLLRTASLLNCEPNDRPLIARQRQAALRWVDGAPAIITFAAVCECFGVDEDWAKAGLMRYAETRGKPPINKGSSGRNPVGIPSHALHVREDFDPAPVEPDPELSDHHLLGSSGQGQGLSGP